MLRQVAKLIPFGSHRSDNESSAPHFVRDYKKMVRHLTKQFGKDEAMQIGVGGDFERVGKCEVSLLRLLGLASGHFVMDVGCGSGRMAIALSEELEVGYHGCDIVPEFLAYARQRTPATYRYSTVDGLTIPEADEKADFVTFFSVATHLMHHETYLYLEEAKRVAKPGGRIVVSFLEFGQEQHWQPFADIVEVTRRNVGMHLNCFIEPTVFPVWAKRLGLDVEAMLPLGEFKTPAGEALALGQSVVVLRKPVA